MSSQSRWQAYVFGGVIVVLATTTAPDQKIEALGFSDFLTSRQIIGFAFWGLLWSVFSTAGEVWSFLTRRFDRWPATEASSIPKALGGASAKHGAPLYYGEQIDPARLAEVLERSYERFLALDDRPTHWRRGEFFREADGMIDRLRLISGKPDAFGLTRPDADKLTVFLNKWDRMRARSELQSRLSGGISFASALALTTVALLLSTSAGLEVGWRTLERVACAVFTG